MSTLVVGDIHGNAAALQDLLSRVPPFLTGGTTVVFLGDYIDRGPDSRGVVARLLAFRRGHSGPMRFLKGNHEQLLQKSLRDSTKHSWICRPRNRRPVRPSGPSWSSMTRITL
jgi:serine/threonine protein phosphatase 1